MTVTGTLINVYNRGSLGAPIANCRLQLQSWETLTNGEKRALLIDITARDNPAAHGLEEDYRSLIGKSLTVHYAQNPDLPGLNLLLAAEKQKTD